MLIYCIVPLFLAIKHNADVIAETDGKQFVSRESDFKIKYILPKNIKSGPHDIIVKAKDDFGNYGELNLKYNIETIPSRLDLIAGEAYNPGDEINMLVNLYDQADDLISGTYNIYIYEGFKKILEEEHSLNEETKLNLPEFAKLGIRKIKISSFGLNKEAQFIINEIKRLEINLNGDILTARNTGNIDFDEELIIKGNELIRTKNLYLGLNEAEEIDLSSLFYEGVYSIEVPFTGQRFDSVSVDEEGVFGTLGNGMTSITGFTVYNVKKTYNKYGYYIIVGLILLIAGLFGMNLMTRIKSINNARKKEYMHGQKRLKELLSMSRTNKYDFRRASSEDVEYFKNNAVRIYNETEKQERPNRIYNRPRDYSRTESNSRNEPPSNGLFSMFK